MREPAPPAERDDLRTLLKGVAIGIGASGVAFSAVGNADERPHRLILLLLLVVAATAGWAGRRLGNRRAASPVRPPGGVTN